MPALPVAVHVRVRYGVIRRPVPNVADGGHSRGGVLAADGRHRARVVLVAPNARHGRRDAKGACLGASLSSGEPWDLRSWANGKR